ncbi:LLM class flavin-dependent oxidoreductase [Streptomyces sp. 4R-3d]|uniref:LLM class flavin-dependent oxidoreductase n=1 Tax=Streptomyces sp. 4R-3d TaxID=2559605 RepID=UPI00107274DC|nr:LLM class flavin-dependent oxidoreductase [Streptomyces sp. 4R-3d]TFI22100.1 LLM class flavin-dependent oxidoreductase [Streptomyces sp. 4R-3d]
MTDLTPPRLSVLDTVPVWQESSAAVSLRHSLDLARHAERLGYTRFWVAEHHNTPSLATSAPAVLAGQVAAATETIRVGSGAVLLPNHAPLAVAEQFGVLSSLYPGRIDLGIGRATGTDAHTARLLRGPRAAGPEEFVHQLAELMGYFAPPTAGADVVAAIPRVSPGPPVWLLGSSASSAVSAARMGLPYAYAHVINPADCVPALRAYRDAFRPSPQLAEPYAILAAGVIVADTGPEADRLGWSFAHGQLLSRIQRGTTLPRPDQTDAAEFTPAHRDFMRQRLATQVYGDPDTVREQLTELVRESAADEVMALTMIWDHAARVRSYELLAGLLDGARAEDARMAVEGRG